MPGSARSSPPSSSFTAMRTAWNSRANSGGPARGPRTARMAFTRSSLAGERLAAPPPHDLPRQAPRPALVAVVGEEPLQPVVGSRFSRSAAVAAAAAHPHVQRRARSESKTPAPSWSNCREETPRSSRTKSGSKRRHRGQGLGVAVGQAQIADPASPSRRRSRRSRQGRGRCPAPRRLPPERLGVAAVAEGGVHHPGRPRAASSTGPSRTG